EVIVRSGEDLQLSAGVLEPREENVQLNFTLRGTPLPESYRKGLRLSLNSRDYGFDGYGIANMEAGIYQLLVEHDLLEVVYREVEIDAEGTTLIEIELEPKPGFAQIVVTPPGVATLYVNGEIVEPDED